jgi:anti-sigma28 factor (negative regulator of flagellin synthesis)
MKIQSDGLQGSAPLETERTQSAPQTTGGSTHGGRKVAGHDGDSVEISSISAHLSEANSVDSQHRTNRIAELSAIHARGDYHANAEKLSRALVAHSIHAAEGGEK